jgi:hypothetical protein
MLNRKPANVPVVIAGIVQLGGIERLPSIGMNNVAKVALVVAQRADLIGIAPNASTDNSRSGVS